MGIEASNNPEETKDILSWAQELSNILDSEPEDTIAKVWEELDTTFSVKEISDISEISEGYELQDIKDARNELFWDLIATNEKGSEYINTFINILWSLDGKIISGESLDFENEDLVVSINENIQGLLWDNRIEFSWEDLKRLEEINTSILKLKNIQTSLMGDVNEGETEVEVKKDDEVIIGSLDKKEFNGTTIE